MTWSLKEKPYPQSPDFKTPCNPGSGLAPSVAETAMGFSSSSEEPELAVLASKEARVAEDIGNPDNSTLSEIPFPASDKRQW